MEKQKSILYLIPTTLGDTPFPKLFPPDNVKIISSLRFFIVENIRSARRFIKSCNSEIIIDDLTFFELNQHTKAEDIIRFIEPLKSGQKMGVISEAGCPAVADPGSDIVAAAHQIGAKVVPLIGPSSILLSLMASGFNGQGFTFLGYLPIQQTERIKTLKKLENRIYSENQTQIFIETPYRNMKMLDDIMATCQSNTKLCIAADITLETEFIQTKTISEWKKQKPELNKRPCIFLLYK